MHPMLHDNLSTKLDLLEEIFKRNLLSNEQIIISKEEYMNFHIINHQLSESSQCAESTLKSFKLWFTSYIKKYYKEYLKTNEDLESEDLPQIYIETHNRIFRNFVNLRKLLQRIFSNFERDITIKLYNLEGNSH